MGVNVYVFSCDRVYLYSLNETQVFYSKPTLRTSEFLRVQAGVQWCDSNAAFLAL